jgi:diaminopimelate epimerase
MRFEKWQALGNDYVIVERDALPWPLTATRVALLCDRHQGLGADGVLELAPPGDGSASVAALRIFNPDGSEAELSGNGAREAILYLRARGWTDADEFAVDTAAGEIRPTILSERECRVAMGRAVVGERGEQPADGDRDGVTGRAGSDAPGGGRPADLQRPAVP